MMKRIAAAITLVLCPMAGSASAIAIDATAFGDRSNASTSITTSTFSTTAPNELLLAFISADSLGTAVRVNSVAGGGLIWVLVSRANAQLGTAEIWRAFATGALSGATVTGTLSQSVAASITVMSFTGVDTSGTNGSGAIGAIVSAGAASGAPTASLVTTRDNSWIFGVGTDWDSPTPRVVGSGQVLVHQYAATVGDIYWVQRQNTVTPAQGTTVTINDTAPTTDRWNMAICEILAGSAATYTVSGTIAPVDSGPDTLVTLGGGATGTATADANGDYSFAGLSSGNYTVTPTRSGYRFTPPQRAVTIAAANQAGVNFTGSVVSGNPIVVENAISGSSNWQLTNPAYDGEIEGYAGATSVNRGEDVALYVNSTGAPFTLDLYRLGWYQGLGGRLMVSLGTLPGQAQPACPQDPTYGLIECSWTVTTTVSVDPTWTTGVYLARVRRTDIGKDNYLTFVVRDDTSTSDILFDSNVNTMQAYNGWGGKALYAGLSEAPRPARSVSNAAVKVSFDRPYKAYDFFGSTDGEDTQFLRWEYQMVRWLESQGFDVSYSTNIDTGLNGSRLLNHRVYLLAGHGEYWPSSMRNNVEAAMRAGVNLAFFAANSAYWQVRFESSNSGVPNRVMVGFKESASTYDPLVNDPMQSTSRFRDSFIQRPENNFLGSMWGDVTGTPVGFPLVVSNSTHPFYRHTGLVNGNSMPGLVGDEWDNTAGLSASNSPPDITDLTVLSNSPTSGANAHSVVHQDASGAVVFNAGTFQWSWGLDNTLTPIQAGDPRVGQITTNILVDMHATPQTPSNVTVSSTYAISGTVTGLGGPATITLTGAASRQTVTDAQGRYIVKLLLNGVYTVRATRTGASFTPAAQTITISSADAPNVDFAESVPTWSISGTVTPVALGSGVQINLTGAATASTTTSGSGTFSLATLANGTYTLTPVKAGTVFTPASRTVTINNANATGANFTAAGTFTVSGVVSPAAAGVQVQLTGAATASTVTDAGGAYSFDPLANGSYTITPLQSGTAFSPASRTVIVNNANVTGVNFTATVAYTLSGTMSPAASGASAIVALSGAATGTATVSPSGAYLFPALAPGQYDVTPGKAGFTFSPATQTVVISGADVANVNFTVTPSATPALATDVVTFRDRSTTGSSIATPAFSLSAPNELLLAFVATDSLGTTVRVNSVAGGSLTWTLVGRANAQLGTAEIWRAFSTAALSNVTVTASLSQNVAASITLVSFVGADPSGTGGSGAIGASTSKSAATGAATASLTTTRNGSWVFGVGMDWDKATSRGVGANQVIVHQYLATIGDTYWVQRQANPTPVAGTVVTINNPTPTGDRSNLFICEVLPAP